LFEPVKAVPLPEDRDSEMGRSSRHVECNAILRGFNAPCQRGSGSAGGHFRRPAGPVTVSASAATFDVRWPDEVLAPGQRILIGLEKPLIHDDRRGRNPHRPQRISANWATTGSVAVRPVFDEFFDFPGNHPDGTRRFEAHSGR